MKTCRYSFRDCRGRQDFYRLDPVDTGGDLGMLVVTDKHFVGPEAVVAKYLGEEWFLVRGATDSLASPA